MAKSGGRIFLLWFSITIVNPQSFNGNLVVPDMQIPMDVNEILMESSDTIAEQPKSSCDDGSCYPAVGDLLIGREQNLTSSSTCGIDDPERYCIVSHLNSAKKCFWCHSNDYDNRNDHSIQKAISNNLANRLSTWWQSENAPNRTVSVQLDLEAQFHFTHLIMTFKTFRPAAMVIERSNDYGQTWKPYRYFADDCDSRFEFGLEENQINIDDVICDDRYSKIEPSTMGEVIYKALDPSAKMPQDPYSPRVQDWILITNLRINFTAFHTLGDDILDPNAGSEVNQKYYYSLYELIIRGNCFCYGHAEECEPVEGIFETVSDHMVHGQCKCMHNTDGRNCERCKPLYNNKPWAPAMHQTTNECEPCTCNDHADKCTFDPDLFNANGMKNGGVCDNCKDNTMGTNCEQCIDGYYRDMNFNLQHPAACRACQCNPNGSINGNVCDKENTDKTTAGYCRCKANVEGESCDRCKPGFFNLDPSNPDGCSPCNCNKLGTVHLNTEGDTCDSETGECYCKQNVFGRYCDRCKDMFWGLDKDEMGCKPCDCISGASRDNTCNKIDGQCDCLENLTGRQCNLVKDQHFVPSLDHFCYEAEDSTEKVNTEELIENILEINTEQIAFSNSDQYDEYTNGNGNVGNPYDESGLSSDNNEFLSNEDLDSFNSVINGNSTSSGFKKSNKNRQDGKDPSKINDSKFRPWTGDGYVKVGSNSTLTIQPINVIKTQNYCVAIRYRMKDTDGYDPEPISVNIQIEDSDPYTFSKDTKMQPNSSCFNTAPGDHDLNLELDPYENHKMVCGQNLCLDALREYTANLQFSGHATIDSLIVVPEVQMDGIATADYPGGPGEVAASFDSYEDDFEEEYTNHLISENRFITADIHAKCVDEVIALPKNISAKCQEVLFGVTTNFFSGAKPCNCNKQGSLSQNCQKTGGQCVCRKNVIGRTCNRCAPYTFGFNGGSDGCEECACNVDGSQFNTMCDRDSGQCKCNPGVTGRQCDKCKPGHYGFPHCYPCECNDHAMQCDQETGQCLDCSDHTEGERCESCVTGYYGDATTSYCRECMCPDGPNSNRQFADTCSLDHGWLRQQEEVEGKPFDQIAQREICHCNEGYTGAKCDQCAPGFYGNPDVEGGRCIRCECNGNIDMIQGACDPRSGKCLLCNRNTAGNNCEVCNHGYFPDGTGGCQSCGCSSDGTNPANCIDGVCGCDQITGKCDCVDTVDGDSCDTCKPQFYGLISSVGCSPCNCDPEQSIIPNCHEENGQCRCKQGFGGRDCSGCEIGYYGIPSVTGCNFCGCNPEGSVGTFIADLNIEVFDCDDNGQCNCLDGIGGKHCDECAYGYYEEYLYAAETGDGPLIGGHSSMDGSDTALSFSAGGGMNGGLLCQKCDQCFYDWDKSIRHLKAQSDIVLDQAHELQKTGITGQYTANFQALDNILEQVEDILNQSVSPEVEHKLEQFDALRGALNAQRQDVLREKNLIDEIKSNDDTLRERLEEFASRLQGMEDRLQTMKETIGRCSKNTPEVAAKQVEKAQKESRKALENAIKMTNDDPESDSLLIKAMKLRNEAESIALTREKEFQIEDDQFQNSVHIGLDAAKSIKIGELNEKICGVNTEGCDPICGGAGCEFCGAKEGEELASPCQGSATQAAQAEAMAQKAKNSLSQKLKSSGTMLKKVKSANEKVEEAQEKVSETHTLAEKLNKRIGGKNQEIKRIIEKIKIFLMEKRDDPDIILAVSQSVLKIPIPTEGQVDYVVEKLRELADKIDNMDERLVESLSRLAEAKKLNDLANSAEMAAREELTRTKDAQRFISESEDINANVTKALSEYSTGTTGWEDKISDLNQGVDQVKKKLITVEDNIKQVYDTIQITSGKSAEITAAAEAVRISSEKSNKVATDAMAKVMENDQLANIISLSETGNHKAKKWIDASERARKIKEKSEDLRRKVQNHIEVLEDLEKDFRTNQQSLADKRKELEGLKKEATLLRKQLRAKLAYYQTKCGGNKG